MLGLDDYSLEFLNWASYYLGRLLVDILALGESFASIVAVSVRSNMAVSHQKRLAD